MVKDFVFTEQSFEVDLLEIAKILLQNSTDNRYIIVLLLYAIHLDIFHSSYSSWYKRDVLVDVLFCIIINHSRYCIKQKFCNYTFFLFICSIVFILFSYWCLIIKISLSFIIPLIPNFICLMGWVHISFHSIQTFLSDQLIGLL